MTNARVSERGRLGPEAALASLVARASEEGIIEIAHTLLGKAIEVGASHMHLEPGATGGLVRYRVGGVLHDVVALPAGLFSPVLARLKLMSDIEWNEHPEPRQGRIGIWHGGTMTAYTALTAAMPTARGESLVLRLVPRPTTPWTWETLGVPEPSRIDALLARGEGLLLFASLPGGGKSAAMAAALAAVDRERRNVFLVAEEQGYRLEGVSQSSAELTADAAVRALAGRDVDVLALDPLAEAEETAAVQEAVESGRLVLACCVAADAAAGVARLAALNFPAADLPRCLLGVVASRLLPRRCAVCGDRSSDREPAALAGGERCEACGGTGKNGRVGAYEVLIPDAAMAGVIAAGEPGLARGLRDRMAVSGVTTLRDEALRLAREGLAATEEVERWQE
jgi:general secretion pathway protein E